MCSINEDIHVEVKPDLKKCLKCDQNSIVVTRINDALCKSCFIEYFTHKFRATIGKSKIFEKDELVLLPYSASGSSVAMLHLIKQGMSEEAKKKFTFKIVCLYIEDSFDRDPNEAKRVEFLRQVEKSVENFGFKFYFSLFENCFEENDGKLFTDKIEKLNFNCDNREKFLSLINSCKSQTSKEELLKRLKNQLIERVAKKLNIIKVIFPISCTKLTVDMLTNFAIGKGAHQATEMSLEERNISGQVNLRPLRELTSKEVAYYNHYSNLNDKILIKKSTIENVPNSTIYRLTEKFINGLQNDYPTTVPTIFRTSDKLTPNEDLSQDHTCIMCGLAIDTDKSASATISAINDLQYSITISRIEKNLNERKFLVDNVCYSCSIVLNDLTSVTLLPETMKQNL
ncbi:cytoplasmic tRNA 2-thiolation 2, partial [Brachionus plicatilis]